MAKHRSAAPILKKVINREPRERERERECEPKKEKKLEKYERERETKTRLFHKKKKEKAEWWWNFYQMMKNGKRFPVPAVEQPSSPPRTSLLLLLDHPSPISLSLSIINNREQSNQHRRNANNNKRRRMMLVYITPGKWANRRRIDLERFHYSEITERYENSLGFIDLLSFGESDWGNQ